MAGLGQFAERRDTKPGCLLHVLAVGAAPALGGGHAKGGHRIARPYTVHLGIARQVAKNSDAIRAASYDTPPSVSDVNVQFSTNNIAHLFYISQVSALQISKDSCHMCSDWLVSIGRHLERAPMRYAAARNCPNYCTEIPDTARLENRYRNPVRDDPHRCALRDGKVESMAPGWM